MGIKCHKGWTWWQQSNTTQESTSISPGGGGPGANTWFEASFILVNMVSWKGHWGVCFVTCQPSMWVCHPCMWALVVCVCAAWGHYQLVITTGYAMEGWGVGSCDCHPWLPVYNNRSRNGRLWNCNLSLPACAVLMWIISLAIMWLG